MVRVTTYDVPMEARFFSNRVYPRCWFTKVWAFGGMDDPAMLVSGYPARETIFSTLYNVLASFQLSPDDFENWTQSKINISYDLCPGCLSKMDVLKPGKDQHTDECPCPEYEGGYTEPVPEPVQVAKPKPPPVPAKSKATTQKAVHKRKVSKQRKRRR